MKFLLKICVGYTAKQFFFWTETKFNRKMQPSALDLDKLAMIVFDNVNLAKMKGALKLWYDMKVLTGS